MSFFCIHDVITTYYNDSVCVYLASICSGGCFRGCAVWNYRCIMYAGFHIILTRLQKEDAKRSKERLFNGATRPAKYTVRVSKCLLRNCVQAHDNCLEVLPHINLYLLTRRPRTIGSPSHVSPSFFWNSVCSRILSFKTKTFFPKIDKKLSKKVRGAAPCTPSLWGCTPPIHQGKC